MTTMLEATQNESVLKILPFFKVILVSLLLLQASLLAYLSWSTSPNRTEVGHIGSAVYLWNVGKFDVFHVNPPLVRAVAGMSIALFCNPEYDWKPSSPRPQDRSEWSLGGAFIVANELDNLRLYVFLMRLACIPLILLGGYFGYRFASELYGQWSGVTFLVLWIFSPLILGWGATICPDVAAASIGIVGLYTFWHWLNTPKWKQAIIAGVCLGLMPLTKITWIIAFPTWLILWSIWLPFKQKRQFVVIMLLGVYMINMGYLFDGSLRPLKDYQFISGTLTGQEITQGKTMVGNRFADSWMGHIPMPLPAEFVQGIDTQKIDFERGMESYAHGIWSDRGWWWYYGYVLFHREPLGVWGLLLLAFFMSCFCRNGNASWRYDLTVLIPLLLVFAFISSQDGLSINPRYVVLVLPLLYIFISKVSSFPSVFRRIPAAVLLAWIVVSSLSFYPHSMSYFNELAGEPKNYPKYLLGSNIDWGQDAYALKTWVEKHREAKPLYISYHSPISLEKLGIESTGTVPTEPTTGWMVIGVNELFTKEGKLTWLHLHEPVAMIGYSIWVYKVNESDL
jgi:4-amino-4-deoxy-L-arabinose transferase-like glycosyltransferase